MNSPRTTREALLAELLGDMDRQLKEIEASSATLEALRLRLLDGYDEKASLAAQRLEKAAGAFEDVTTRNVDAFVSVANEALSKFVKRTNEIKDALDSLNASSDKATVIAPAAVAPGGVSGEVAAWLLPLLFIAGCVVGVCITFAVLK